MPLSKEKQMAYQRRRRLKNRMCEGCGIEVATTHHQAAPKLRTIAVCSGCRKVLVSRVDYVVLGPERQG